LDAGALLTHEERDDLELDAVRRAQLAALGFRLHLAHLAGEDGDDGCLVVSARRAAASGSGSAGGCRGRHAPPERRGRLFAGGPGAEAGARRRHEKIGRASAVVMLRTWALLRASADPRSARRGPHTSVPTRHSSGIRAPCQRGGPVVEACHAVSERGASVMMPSTPSSVADAHSTSSLSV